MEYTVAAALIRVLRQAFFNITVPPALREVHFFKRIELLFARFVGFFAKLVDLRSDCFPPDDSRKRMNGSGRFQPKLEWATSIAVRPLASL